MKNNYIIILGITTVTILALLVLAVQSKNVEVSTNTNNYESGGSLTVNIKNYAFQSICFSGCYPYYLEEKKDGQWVSYDYGECQKKDKVANCVLKDKIKAFKLELSDTNIGFHRLKLPVCVGCAVGQDFRIDKIFYSNLFEIK